MTTFQYVYERRMVHRKRDDCARAVFVYFFPFLFTVQNYFFKLHMNAHHLFLQYGRKTSNPVIKSTKPIIIIHLRPLIILQHAVVLPWTEAVFRVRFAGKCSVFMNNLRKKDSASLILYIHRYSDSEIISESPKKRN